ncbi:MAG TPA: hypothetical protein VF666_09985 [Pyrinomonadaceae bacterium]|jgi:hypothetical protein
MKPSARPSFADRRVDSFSSLTRDFPDARIASELLHEFLQNKTYNRNFALKLLDLARCAVSASWETRRLATLMLEHQFLQIPPAELDEFDFLLAHLQLKPAAGLNVKIHDTVLREGFTTTDVRRFIEEFRRKLERLRRVHEKIRGKSSSRLALSDFIHLSRRECRLSLARYLFRPEEVVARILSQTIATSGIPDLNPDEPSHVRPESAHAVSQLPPFEAAILEQLRAHASVYWVAAVTSSELDSLVEYPLTSVVLVVKPPGSHHEFEIKRAGRRGRHPLGVVHTRDGDAVPPSHRLDGGSSQGLLRYEANLGSKFSRIFRLVHGVDASMSTMASRTSITHIPVRDGEANLLNYFTEPRIFGRGFREMRAAMSEAVASFLDEEGKESLNLPGDVGLTVQFLTHVAPTQAILTGTSSFRLDRLAAYLSDNGAHVYFREGLSVAYSKHDARRLADEVLDEVLCVYQPPPVEYRSHGQYVEAAFALTENRERADRNYLASMSQIGMFWGTLLAVRGNSSGESFVARNVGMRSVWEDARWKIKIIFMDHDSLSIRDATVENFHSLGTLQSTALDELFIWGVWESVRHVVGSVDCLEAIYRVGQELSLRGQDAFHQSLAEAYKKTHQSLDANPQLQQFFHPTFRKRIRDWDTIVARYLKIRHDARRVRAWKREMLKTFRQKGYEKNIVLEHLIAAERFANFLAKYSYLY